MNNKVNVGVIGCGKISEIYLKAAKLFPNIQIVACADIKQEVAKQKAKEHGIEAIPVERLLKASNVEIVLNLTTPQSHTEVNLKALHAGKHVHCEKPLALTRREGMTVINLAQKQRLLVGCAPDTFLGGGLQTCRKMIDDGCIGKAVSGTAIFMEQDSDSECPIPEFLYKKGGGPLFDFGPYYITALVNLLGPVKRVCALSAITFKERIATCEDQAIRVIPVDVPTHIAGTLEFTCGALITLIMSFDVWHHSNHPIEIHGEEGSMKVPDPNIFDGPVYINKPGDEGWQSVPLSHGYTNQMRIIGVADMACAIRGKRKNRCNGELAYHVLDVMESLIESSTNGKYIHVESTIERPAPLPLGLEGGELEAQQ